MINKTDRAIAVSILTDVLDSGTYANIALRKTLSKLDIDSQARAFVTDLVNETLRNLIQIDYFINNFSKTPVKDMKPFIRNVLRVSVCQIKYMEKIPDRASVNEAVVLTKAYGYTNLAGYVNAVLRNIARENSNSITSLSLKYSYPNWLMEKLHLWLGEENTLNFCENSHRPPPLTVLTNTYKTNQSHLAARLQEERITATPLENLAYPFLVLRQPGDITRLSAFKEGLFFVIDPGAMHAVEAMNLRPGQTVIDMCAAPGGKSFAAAFLMKNEGVILSHDIYPHRIELIKKTCIRLGLSIISPAVKDSVVFDPALEESADAVLLDVPCSGFGTIRKHPDIKYTRQPKDINDLAKVQKSLLSTAAKYVKPGGILVYCTCTITTEENTDNIKHFLETHSNFTLISEQQFLPSPTSDAFFVAALTKT